MNLTNEIFLVLLTYIWGSIPYGYILIRFYTGKNILKLGSGNVGSTNVGRIAGKKLSFITQLLDMLKGLLPVALFMVFQDETSNTSYNYVYLLALAAVLGHNFSVFLRFKGGKGVNTTLGASLLVAPFSVIISAVIFLIVKSLFKYVSLGSIVLGISLPVIELIIHSFTPTFYYLSVCALLIMIMHRKNIDRLWHNKEMLS